MTDRLHDNPLTVQCMGMAESSAASSTASLRCKRVQGVWGWKCKQNGRQSVGQVRCGSTWLIDTIDKEAAELIALGELLVDLLNQPSGEDVEIIMNSVTNAFDLLFSTNPFRHKLCVQRLRQLMVLVERRRRIRWILVDSLDGDDAFYGHLMFYLSTSTPIHHSRNIEIEDRLVHLLKRDITTDTSRDEVQSIETVSKQLVEASRIRFQNWSQSTSIPRAFHQSMVELEHGWGNCGSISTFSLNRMPWHKLSDWLILLEEEVDFSLLALQEIYEETGAIEAG
eukprot:6473494-Amphidinium_carterae.1